VSFFKRYFNTNSLKLAIVFSAPIYLSILGDHTVIKLINSIVAIIAFYYFLNVKHSFFQSGFFIGIFWFWWIGLSFKYYGFSYLIPVIILLIGIGYGVIFWILNKVFNFLKIPKILWGVFLVFGFDFLKPFTFDWLKPDILIANSFFTPYKITFLLIILAALVFNYKKLLSLLLIISALLIPSPKIPSPPLKIDLVTTYIPQDKKWDKDFIPIEIQNNFAYINDAIKKGYDVVVLPESAFPLFLNMYPNLMQELKELSLKITIVTGALHLKDDSYYNATYVFENKKVTILDKHILVPFGEYIPFPIFQKEINELFFGGASDYKTSNHFNTFKIKNIPFINAICYEATVEDLYKLKPTYIIAMSNLAWFYPPLTGTIQKLLIKVYATRYHKKVYHSLNYYPSYVIN
jgi:apolipoprotein N-acyltransferase